MNTSSLISIMTFDNNSTTTNIESWFIPLDILMIVCISLIIIFATFFLFIMTIDKTCHSVPMMLIANSCLAELILACDMFAMTLFTLQNDLKQIEYQDSFCVFRSYIANVACAVLNYSYFLQSIYRYVTIVYPTRLFCQSRRIQILFICITWIFAFVYPLEFMFNGEIIYNVNNQICQLPLRFSFSIIYMSSCSYIIPISLTLFIYLKLVRYVKEISRRVTPVNRLSRARRELQIARHIVIVVMFLVTLSLPYGIFLFMSIFNSVAKYNFRIVAAFFDVSSVFIMITLFKFTEPLKRSIMKRIKRRPNVVVARVT